MPMSISGREGGSSSHPLHLLLSWSLSHYATYRIPPPSTICCASNAQPRLAIRLVLDHHGIGKRKICAIYLRCFPLIRVVSRKYAGCIASKKEKQVLAACLPLPPFFLDCCNQDGEGKEIKEVGKERGSRCLIVYVLLSLGVLLLFPLVLPTHATTRSDNDLPPSLQGRKNQPLLAFFSHQPFLFHTGSLILGKAGEEWAREVISLPLLMGDVPPSGLNIQGGAKGEKSWWYNVG